jgi:hypothetical protein
MEVQQSGNFGCSASPPSHTQVHNMPDKGAPAQTEHNFSLFISPYPIHSRPHVKKSPLDPYHQLSRLFCNNRFIHPIPVALFKGRESLLSKSCSSPFAPACGIVQQLSQRHLDAVVALQHHCGYTLCSCKTARQHARGNSHTPSPPQATLRAHSHTCARIIN